MVNKGVPSTATSYVLLLNAYAVRGMVREAAQVLEDMHASGLVCPASLRDAPFVCVLNPYSSLARGKEVLQCYSLFLVPSERKETTRLIIGCQNFLPPKTGEG